MSVLKSGGSTDLAVRLTDVCWKQVSNVAVDWMGADRSIKEHAALLHSFHLQAQTVPCKDPTLVPHSCTVSARKRHG